MGALGGIHTTHITVSITSCVLTETATSSRSSGESNCEEESEEANTPPPLELQSFLK